MDELLGANTDTLDRMAESLPIDARTLQDIRTRGRQVVAEIEAAWNGPNLWYLIQQWEQEGLPQLASASTSLETCACQLPAQSTAQGGQQSRRQRPDRSSRGWHQASPSTSQCLPARAADHQQKRHARPALDPLPNTGHRARAPAGGSL